MSTIEQPDADADAGGLATGLGLAVDIDTDRIVAERQPEVGLVCVGAQVGLSPIGTVAWRPCACSRTAQMFVQCTSSR